MCNKGRWKGARGLTQGGTKSRGTGRKLEYLSLCGNDSIPDDTSSREGASCVCTVDPILLQQFVHGQGIYGCI